MTFQKKKKKNNLHTIAHLTFTHAICYMHMENLLKGPVDDIFMFFVCDFLFFAPGLREGGGKKLQD